MFRNDFSRTTYCFVCFFGSVLNSTNVMLFHFSHLLEMRIIRTLVAIVDYSDSSFSFRHLHPSGFQKGCGWHCPHHHSERSHWSRFVRAFEFSTFSLIAIFYLASRLFFFTDTDFSLNDLIFLTPRFPFSSLHFGATSHKSIQITA